MTTLSNIQDVATWTAHEWESYAVAFWNDQPFMSGREELAGGKHCFSWTWFSGVAGRASYFKDKERKVAVLTFRGAVKPENWKNCVRFESVHRSDVIPDQSIKVHNGFADEYVALKEVLREKKVIEDIEALPGDWKLLLTGSSMGGALATICVADLFFNHSIDENKMGLITFGAPRTGNQAFARRIDRLNLFLNRRVEIEGDCFARLPKQHHGEFWHRGELSFFDKDFKRVTLSNPLVGEGTENNPSGEWEKMAAEINAIAGWCVAPILNKQMVEDVGVKTVPNLSRGWLGLVSAFKTHVSYIEPYKDNAFNKEGRKIALGTSTNPTF